MLTEAILLHLQNNLKKAYDTYYEFCYLYNDIFPDIVSDVKIFMFLFQENLKLPSNWKEIYKYRLLRMRFKNFFCFSIYLSFILLSSSCDKSSKSSFLFLNFNRDELSSFNITII